ncbi:hypothetical protein [Mucilaginibacter sp. PPCGB 2223]|uniref:hypothetical protein n=1 Tax=Mucilaginibacter sp. PPCGB 2223 TaxID=1886027 RepID=UPI001112611E|nr:hypothetical protein [Mucilaginibacter sp. PPCGB 2223]
MSTTHVDSHKDKMSLEALIRMKDTINSDKKLRWGVDHNKEFPPVGQLINAEIVQRDEHYYLEADYKPYDYREEVPWDNTLLMESFKEGYPFIEIDLEIPTETIVAVDPNSFISDKHYNLFLQETQALNYPFIGTEHLRKANASTPEIIFTVGQSAIIYHIIKPLAKKIGKKIADKAEKVLVEKGEDFYQFISRTIISAFSHGASSNRPPFVVFQINGIPNIELIAKTSDHDLIIKALKDNKLKAMIEEIDFYRSKFEIEKIQFILTTKGKWKFNYLLTPNGAVVGKKDSFKKRDRRLDIVLNMNDGKVYNSVGLSNSKKRT